MTDPLVIDKNQYKHKCLIADCQRSALPGIEPGTPACGTVTQFLRLGVGHVI